MLTSHYSCWQVSTHVDKSLLMLTSLYMSLLTLLTTHLLSILQVLVLTSFFAFSISFSSSRSSIPGASHSPVTGWNKQRCYHDKGLLHCIISIYNESHHISRVGVDCIKLQRLNESVTSRLSWFLKRCGIINTLTIGSREWGGVVLPTFTGAWQWWIVVPRLLWIECLEKDSVCQRGINVLV